MASKPKFRIVPVDVPASAPYLPPVIAQEQAWSIKALLAGQASEAEQGIAVRFIIHSLSEADSITFRPDIRDDAYAQGKKHVGHWLVRTGQMTPEEITKLPKFKTSMVGLEDDEMPTS